MLDTAPLRRDSVVHERGAGFVRRLETSFARGETAAGTGAIVSAASLLSENAELSEIDCADPDTPVVAGAFSLPNGSAPRLGIARPFSLLRLGDGGVRGWLHSCFVCCGGVCGSSCSAIGNVPPSSSPNGVESRLGGGELSPDLASGESPGRRFGERMSISELLELQLALEGERASTGWAVRSPFGNSPRTL